MKVEVLLVISLSCCVQCFTKNRRRVNLLDESDSGQNNSDYFELVVDDFEVKKNNDLTTTTAPGADNQDDGVTCSLTNITDILPGFELENNVLVIFKLNVSANERELILFLDLAKRFSTAPAVFSDHRFIVLTTDLSSNAVNDFIEAEDYPADIVAIDEDDFPDLGFEINLDELHVYLVDQCGKLSFIVVPPWSSAEHPYVKAALLSTIVDLPCGCPASEFASALLISDSVSSSRSVEQQTESTTSTDTVEHGKLDFEELASSGNTTATGTTISKKPEIDLEAEDIESIENLLDNSNQLDYKEIATETSFPLRCIIPSIHIHYDNESANYWKYDQIVLKSNDPSNHAHLANGEKVLEISANERNFHNITTIDAKIYVGNQSALDIQAIAKTNQTFVDRLGNFYKISKKLEISDGYELVPIEYDIVKVAPSRQESGVRAHYELLSKWLTYKI